jgi:mannose-6-phosphate isomerase-like protein (cupin superfamily)
MVAEPVVPKNVEIVHRGQRDVIDILGIWCEWKTTEDETNQHYCVLEMTVPPGAGVPLHRHAIQETFTVMEGEAEFGRLGSNGPEWTPITPGDVVNVPNWAYHGFRNLNTVPAKIQLTCAAGLEGFFRECGIRVDPGTTLSPSAPSASEIERVAAIGVKHGSYFYAAEAAPTRH